MGIEIECFRESDIDTVFEIQRAAYRQLYEKFIMKRNRHLPVCREDDSAEKMIHLKGVKEIFPFCRQRIY